MSRNLAAIARKMGAFYERGAWYFPSVWAKQEFQRIADGLGYIVE